MDEERRGTWFGFGFCGFGQALGSGLGRQVHSPEPLRTPGGSLDVRRVSSSWSYTAFMTRELPLRPRPRPPAHAAPSVPGERRPQPALHPPQMEAGCSCRALWAAMSLPRFLETQHMPINQVAGLSAGEGTRRG